MYYLNLIIFLLIIPGLNKAQIFKKSYIKGYIVTDKDTIKGFIRQERNYTGKIHYKITGDGTKKKIKVKNIETLKAGTTLYRKVEYRNKPMIMKELIRGPVSLFSVQLPEIAKTEQVVRSQYQQEEYYLKKKIDVIKVTKEAFHKELSYYFDDYPELADKIFSKFYKYDNLIDIVTKYNYWYNYKRSLKK